MGMNPNNLCYERVQQQNEIFKQNHLQPNRDFMVNRICRTNRQSRPRTRPSFNTRQDYWFDDTKGYIDQRSHCFRPPHNQSIYRASMRVSKVSKVNQHQHHLHRRRCCCYSLYEYDMFDADKMANVSNIQQSSSNVNRSV